MQCFCWADHCTFVAEDALRSIFSVEGFFVDLHVHGTDPQTFATVDTFTLVTMDPQQGEIAHEMCIRDRSYVSYEPCAILAGGKPVIIELKAENEFRLTPEELLEHITDKTKILVLPYPNNPTGAIMERADLEKIAEIVMETVSYTHLQL